MTWYEEVGEISVDTWNKLLSMGTAVTTLLSQTNKPSKTEQPSTILTTSEAQDVGNQEPATSYIGTQYEKA